MIYHWNFRGIPVLVTEVAGDVIDYVKCPPKKTVKIYAFRHHENDWGEPKSVCTSASVNRWGFMLSDKPIYEIFEKREVYLKKSESAELMQTENLKKYVVK